jgi:hypothetical protein
MLTARVRTDQKLCHQRRATISLSIGFANIPLSLPKRQGRTINHSTQPHMRVAMPPHFGRALDGAAGARCRPCSRPSGLGMRHWQRAKLLKNSVRQVMAVTPGADLARRAVVASNHWTGSAQQPSAARRLSIGRRLHS